MNVFRNDVLHITKQEARLAALVSQSRYLFCCMLLAGCVANSTIPSQSVEVSLTPIESSQDSQAQLTEPASTLPPPVQGTDEHPLSPTVKNALVPADTSKEPAEVATEVAAAASKVENIEPNLQPTVSKSAPVQEAKKKKSFFETLFTGNSSNSSKVNSAKTQINKTDNSSEKKVAKLTPSKGNGKPRPRLVAIKRGRAEGLPGVSLKNLFGIDAEETEEFDEPLRVAGVTNLARRGSHGLLIQRPGVKVGCFPRKLVNILKRVERRYGRAAVVTSGFRSPKHNRRVRGARNSTHTRCLAADIQVKGVSKWALAKYLRSLPERGGVGTYCYTKSVHIDIGSKRAWHHCKKRRRKKRRRS